MNYEEYTAPNGPWTEIDGWNEQGVFTAIEIIHDLQREDGIVGNVGEIGVHEGQMFCALALLTNVESEGSLAIDVFDDQDRNVDDSGGNIDDMFDTFRRHVDHVIGDRQRNFRHIEADSLTLSATQLRTALTVNTLDSMVNGILEHKPPPRVAQGRFRLFSIDGGHTVVHVLNDLRLAERIMVPGGVVVVDDYMHPKWPGVTEGLHIYCADRASRLVPFAYGNRKMYLTTFDRAKLYSPFCHMVGKTKLSVYKNVELFGRSVALVHFE
jgi:hypothetical protein